MSGHTASTTNSYNSAIHNHDGETDKKVQKVKLDADHKHAVEANDVKQVASGKSIGNAAIKHAAANAHVEDAPKKK